MKLLLSIPFTTADPAVYILSGAIPVEAKIDNRALTLFGNISRLTSSSIEKRIAHRQLNVKGQMSNSGSWHSGNIVSSMILPQPLDILNDPPGKEKRKRIVNKQVKDYRTNRLSHQPTL